MILRCRPVYVGNFEYDATSREIEKLCEKYGDLERVDMKTGYRLLHNQTNTRAVEPSLDLAVVNGQASHQTSKSCQNTTSRPHRPHRDNSTSVVRALDCPTSSLTVLIYQELVRTPFTGMATPLSTASENA